MYIALVPSARSDIGCMFFFITSLVLSARSDIGYMSWYMYGYVRRERLYINACIYWPLLNTECILIIFCYVSITFKKDVKFFQLLILFFKSLCPFDLRINNLSKELAHTESSCKFLWCWRNWIILWYEFVW